MADLCGKVFLGLELTDRKPFESLSLCDLWWNAKMPWVFDYEFHSRKLTIPLSWQDKFLTSRREVLAEARRVYGSQWSLMQKDLQRCGGQRPSSLMEHYFPEAV